MEDFRRYISEHSEEFLTLIASTEESVGQKIEADCYKRPKPCNHPELERFFYWKGQIGCTRHEDFSESTFEPELADRVLAFFEKLIPLYDYFNQFKV